MMVSTSASRAAIDDAAGECDQRLDPAGGLFGQRGAGLVLRGLAHGLADRGQDRGHGVGDIVEFGADLRIGQFIGRDRQIARLEIGSP